MAIGATMQWRIRAGGNELNGGGYDPQVSGAGTDYTDQDSPQVSVTDGVTNGTTTVTSATASFTSAMIGNVIRIAGDGYYVITARGSSTSITVDRSTANGGSSRTFRIGGAHAHILSYANGGGGTQPILTTPLAPGHTIYIRGGGTDTPSSADYDFSASYWSFPAGDASTGPIKFIGYNGRPRLHHCGVMITGAQYWVIRQIFLYQSVATFTDYGPIYWTTTLGYVCYNDVVFDQNGIDGRQIWALRAHIYKCWFKNTGGGSAGINAAIEYGHVQGFIYGCVFDGIRGPAIRFNGTCGSVVNSLIINGKSDGIVETNSDGGQYVDVILNCTIDANAGHGINVSSTGMNVMSIINTIISNHTGSGKYGINCADSLATNRLLVKNVIDYNNFYGNTNNFNGWELQPNDKQVNPAYANSAGGDYSIGGPL